MVASAIGLQSVNIDYLEYFATYNPLKLTETGEPNWRTHRKRSLPFSLAIAISVWEKENGPADEVVTREVFEVYIKKQEESFHHDTDLTLTNNILRHINKKAVTKNATNGFQNLKAAREAQAATSHPELAKGRVTQAATSFPRLAEGRATSAATGWPALARGRATIAAKGYPSCKKANVARASAARISNEAKLQVIIDSDQFQSLKRDGEAIDRLSHNMRQKLNAVNAAIAEAQSLEGLSA